MNDIEEYMAKQDKVALTQSKLLLDGVQVTFTVNIGDWRKSVAISPIDYTVFKKWDKVYADYVVQSIVKHIEHELAASLKAQSLSNQENN